MLRKAFLGRMGATLLAGTGASNLLRSTEPVKERSERGNLPPRTQNRISEPGKQAVLPEGGSPEQMGQPLLKPPRLKSGDTIGITPHARIVYDASEVDSIEPAMDAVGSSVA